MIFNFDNIGRKIKKFTKWVCWIVIILIWTVTAIRIIDLCANDLTDKIFIFIIGAIIISLFVWIGSWVMYAFGEIAEDVHAMRKKICEREDDEKAKNKNEAYKDEAYDNEEYDNEEYEDEKYEGEEDKKRTGFWRQLLDL